MMDIHVRVPLQILAGNLWAYIPRIWIADLQDTRLLGFTKYCWIGFQNTHNHFTSSPTGFLTILPALDIIQLSNDYQYLGTK